MDLRPSPLAGTWYSNNPQTLRRNVQRQLAHAHGLRFGQLIALLAPHAGHRYSGPIASEAFALIRPNEFTQIVLAGPYHYEHSSPLLTSGHEAYATPLGTVEIARDLVDDIDHRLRSRRLALTAIREDPEHSIEIELPFLQTILPAARLAPLMLAGQSESVSRALGAAMAEAVSASGAPTLLVASSDLSHFYSQHRAQELDREMLRRIESLDPAAVLDAEAHGTGCACGHGGIAAVLWAALALGATRGTLLRYGTSADVTGDASSVVGYGSAAIWKQA